MPTVVMKTAPSVVSLPDVMMLQKTQTLNLSPFSNQRDHGQRILSPQNPESKINLLMAPNKNF
jgi:hypothetical protein